jgi:serine/threonine protein phosphatase 1
MGRTFVLGDIHGAYRALLQVLERAKFDYATDHLIALGDVADGWPDTKPCIDELLKIKNLTYIFGNHDFWTLQWMETGTVNEVWYDQGGKATIESYASGVPESHLKFLDKALPFFEIDARVFVHAGIDPEITLNKNSLQTLLWDRAFAKRAVEIFQNGTNEKLTQFKEVYVGHTPIAGNKPFKAADVWLMDTGAGWSGVLSIMNVHSKEYFTSDEVPTLYPGIEGRKRKS